MGAAGPEPVAPRPGALAAGAPPTMNVLVSGTTGLIGSALVREWERHGHRVLRLVRCGAAPAAGEVRWNPAADTPADLKLDAGARAEAIVHLAGENIAAGRWTTARRARIRESRVRGTRLLAEAAAQLAEPPRVFIGASAIGIYGDRGSELLRETSPPGDDFLAGVCREWEAATAPAEKAGIRVVHLRLGVVLDARGGALARMLPAFRWGVGGVLGSGRQWLSWIALDDVIGAIRHLLNTASVQGAVNAVAPSPVTNREFVRALGAVLRRPTALPVPAFVLRALLGEMAQALLLSSQRVEPARLVASGYRFRLPELGGALGRLLAGS
jgi:uncharacterized protein